MEDTNSPKRRSSSLRAMVENRQLTIPFISSTVVEENWTRLLAKLGQCSARGLDYYCLLIDEHSISYVSTLEANYGQSFSRAACTSPDTTGKEYLQALSGRCTSVLNSDSDIDVSSHKRMASEFYSSNGDDPIVGTQVVVSQQHEHTAGRDASTSPLSSFPFFFVTRD